MTTFTPMLSAATIFVVMLLVAWALIRKRNVLHAKFGAPEGMRKIINIGGGMRILIVEIDGQRIACAVGKTGVTAMQILSATDKASSS